ncbi:Heat shock 70 kDa protein BIP2, partial [Linum perenne]
NRTTPSLVAFSAVDSKQLLIREAAKNQTVLNPTRTIFDVKRLMGKSFKDVQKDLAYLPYTVVNIDGKPYVKLELASGVVKTCSPEQTSAMILGKMKEIAESWLGNPVSGVVVTVPAYFIDAQRQATKNAGIIAGLDVLMVINEPTAAAVAYALNNKDYAGEKRKRNKSTSKILVYDLGGGTFDVSVMEVQDGRYEVLATGGDDHLGGEDFDQKLMDHFIRIINKKYKKDISGDSRALGKLRKECERAKRDLSNQNEVRVEIEYFVDGGDLSESLTRAKFEGMNMHLLKKTFDVVEKTLNDAKVDKSEIDEIVLVGGSTRIPKLKEMLKCLFNGKEEPSQGVNPDEAVAYGAAILGLNLSAQPCAKYVIPRNTRIPIQMSKTFYTVDARQTSVEIEVFQRERALTRNCLKLGSFDLNGIPPAPRGVASVKVTFAIDVDGILSITAKDNATAKSESLDITSYKSSLTENEMEEMIRDAKLMAKEDKMAKARVEAKNRLEQLINEMKNLENAILEATTWFENHEKSIERKVSKEDYEEKMQMIVRLWNPIISKIYGREGKK